MVWSCRRKGEARWRNRMCPVVELVQSSASTGTDSKLVLILLHIAPLLPLIVRSQTLWRLQFLQRSGDAHLVPFSA